MRRACSSGVNCISVYPRLADVRRRRTGPRSRMRRSTAGGTRPSSGSPCGREDADLPRGDRGRLDVEEEDSLRAGRASAAPTSSRPRSKPGRVATPSRVSSSTASGSFQVRKSTNWSAPMRKMGSSNRSLRSRSTVRGYGSSRTSSSGNAARASSSRTSAGQLDVLVPRTLGDEHGQRAAARSAPSRRVRARRARRAAGRTLRRRGLLPFERLLSELDLVALARARRLQDRLELVRLGRAAGDAEAAVGAEDAVRATRRLRPVDEVVDELGVVRRRRNRGA